MAFIRPYKESDFDACAHICQATLPPSLSSNPLTVKLSPYLWTHQYTFLSPSTCFILDDGTGQAIGYCIGTPDIHAFASNYPSYISQILSPVVSPPTNLTDREPWTLLSDGMLGQSIVSPVALAQQAYKPEWLLSLENDPYAPDDTGMQNEARAAQWRATMHIDILPEWQRKGWGHKLIAQFVESVRNSGANYGDGIQIGVAAENSKVVPFYEKEGFSVLQQGGGTIIMTKKV